MNKNIKRVALATLLLITSVAAMADNGHQLWLRQTGLDNPACNVTQKAFNPTATDTESQTVRIAMSELLARISQKLNIQLEKRTDAPANDGFTISRRGSNITISSASGIGLLYGAFALIRMQQTDTHALGSGSITEIPASPLRILNHWDNLNGTIERGYAGRSIFWSDKGEIISQNAPLLVEYARANASIGINGTVLNNVNASPKVLTADYLKQTAHVARILRPYGIRVYLSINFASPKALGDLTTADPLDEDVAAWWKAKAKEIYDLIPDFGGFLVKANSEGEPGPGDYGRTHVEGANMLAAAVKPYGGIIMWRAFVYAANSPDRAKQAYEEFMPLDGQFADNVILQVKNGPVDFQPREPIHPLFLSMKKTPVMPEWQITQEYLGHSIHNVFLAPMWKEMLDDWRTYGTGANRSFADMKIPAIAGVSNIGNSVNWCGSDMAQANWYAFGRLAWNPAISSEKIAQEFISQTLTKDKKALAVISDIMLRSHEACVSYMMPMGLHHIFAGGHHYGPEPWYAPRGTREDWLPRYYHRADSVGLGFDRTMRGTGAVAEYPDEMAKILDDFNLCPEKYLLWFHHVGWQQTLPNGKNLWETLCAKYDEGVREAEDFAAKWATVKQYIDPERFAAIGSRYERQAKDAWWWRDACLLYFQQFSQMPLPEGAPAPRHNLADLQRFHLAIDNYTAPDMSKLP
ncbi:MAG: alpha-glucuronidase [Bacteroidaceae bacterium]|nr:alpha-glucuronidase [Bacteroidaceae bacterium]